MYTMDFTLNGNRHRAYLGSKPYRCATFDVIDPEYCGVAIIRKLKRVHAYHFEAEVEWETWWTTDEANE